MPHQNYPGSLLKMQIQRPRLGNGTSHFLSTSDFWYIEAKGAVLSRLNPTTSYLIIMIVAILIGAALLLITGVASWRIMLSVVLGATAVGLLINGIGGNEYMELPFYYHFLMGGFAFGCVFMATDPVTAAQTNAGKWIYGFLIGAIAVILRVFNPAYPEGMMLAILLMNVFAPLLDYYVVDANIRARKKRMQVTK